VPPEIDVDASAWDRRGAWASHEIAHRVLDTVVPVFDRAGIETLAVKGVVTAHTLYDDPSERPLGDVDLRIRPRDVVRAMRVARDAGWFVIHPNPPYGAFGMFIGSLALGVDVESVVGAPGLCKLSIDEMLARATDSDRGARVRVPELHDHAVLLCVNVFKDKFDFALPWAIEDARRIVDAKGFDVDLFVDRARRARIACIAWLVADWMASGRASARWATVKAKLGGARGPRPIYAWLFRRLRERGAGALGTRMLARAAGDDALMWVEGWRKALGMAAIFGPDG
jgi:hypothetical protein